MLHLFYIKTILLWTSCHCEIFKYYVSYLNTSHNYQIPITNKSRLFRIQIAFIRVTTSNSSQKIRRIMVPRLATKFDLEIAQRSRSQHGTNRKGWSQWSCIPNIKNTLLLILQKICHAEVFVTDRQTDRGTDGWVFMSPAFAQGEGQLSCFRLTDFLLICDDCDKTSIFFLMAFIPSNIVYKENFSVLEKYTKCERLLTRKDKLVQHMAVW